MWLTLVNTAALSLSSSLSAQVIFFELILFVIVFFFLFDELQNDG